MSNNKDSWIKKNWLKLYFVFIILILVISSAGNVWDFVSYARGEKTDAIVTESVNKRVKSGARKQTSYKVTKIKIRYSVSGTEYNPEIKLQGWYKLKEGESLKVSYDPENPENVIIPQKMYEGIKFEILWGIFVGVQLIFVIKHGRKKHDIPNKQSSDELLTNQAKIS